MKYLWLVLLAVLLIMAGLSAFLGYKKGWFKTVMALIANVAAVLVAFGLTKLIAVLAGPSLAGTISGVIGNFVTEDAAREVFSGANALVFYQLIGEILLAVVLFPLLYLAFYFLSKIPQHLILKKFVAEDRIPASPVEGPGLTIAAGAVSGLLSFLFFFSTLSGTAVTLQRTAVAHSSYEQVLDSDAVAIAGNPVFTVDSVLTKPIYLGLVGSNMKELTRLEDLALYAVDFDYAQETDDQIDALEGLRTAFNDSTVLAPFAADLIHAATTAWVNGESFMGITMELSSDLSGSLLKALLQTMSDMDTANIYTNVNSIIDLVELIVRNDSLAGLLPTTGMKQAAEIAGAASDTGSTGTDAASSAAASVSSIMELASDPEELEEFYMVFLTNDDLSGLLPALTSAGLNETMAGMGVKVPSDLVLDADLSGMSEAEIKTEAELTSAVVNNLTDFVNTHEGFYIDKASAEDVSEFMDLLAELDDSVVAQSMLPTLVSGVGGAITKNFPETAADVAKASTLSDLATIVKNYQNK